MRHQVTFCRKNGLLVAHAGRKITSEDTAEDLVAELKLKLFCWRIYGIGMTIVVVVLTCLI